MPSPHYALNAPNTVIVDSSVWIDYFKNLYNPYTKCLDNLLSTASIGMTDIILMEVLRGFREDKHFTQALNLLSPLICFEIVDKQKALRYADYYRQLRKKGITIRKSNDVMIAGYCIDNQIPLLFSDKDFVPFVKYLGLVPALDMKFH